MDKKEFLEELDKLPRTSHLFNVVIELENLSVDEGLNIFEEVRPLKIVPGKEVIFYGKKS